MSNFLFQMKQNGKNHSALLRLSGSETSKHASRLTCLLVINVNLAVSTVYTSLQQIVPLCQTRATSLKSTVCFQYTKNHSFHSVGFRKFIRVRLINICLGAR